MSFFYILVTMKRVYLLPILFFAANFLCAADGAGGCVKRSALLPAQQALFDEMSVIWLSKHLADISCFLQQWKENPWLARVVDDRDGRRGKTILHKMFPERRNASCVTDIFLSCVKTGCYRRVCIEGVLYSHPTLVHVQDDDGNTVVHYVARDRQSREKKISLKPDVLIKLLVTAGADFSMKNNDGLSPIDIAIQHASAPTLNAFLTYALKSLTDAHREQLRKRWNAGELRGFRFRDEIQVCDGLPAIFANLDALEALLAEGEVSADLEAEYNEPDAAASSEGKKRKWDAT